MNEKQMLKKNKTGMKSSPFQMLKSLLFPIQILKKD